MMMPARTSIFAVRLLAGLVPLSVLILATATGKQPAPVIPTVPSPTTLPVRPLVQLPKKVENPTPMQLPIQPGGVGNGGKGDKNNQNGNNNNNKYPETGPELSLGECIAIALERNPALKAAKDSAAATERGYRALTNFGTPATIINPDLEIRKQQAYRGLMATSAEYQKRHNEIVQDVTRLYYSAVYAKQQLQVADNAVTELKTLVDVGRDLLEKTKDPKLLEGFNTIKLKMMELGLLEAKKLQAKARLGRPKALAALREVMGVNDCDFPFRIKDTELPVMKQNLPVTKEMVVAMALERRPELVLAAAGVDAFRLEVYAQGRIPFRRVVPTLASGSDIHSKEIPQTVRTATEYRPGGIIPEMPTQLVGSKYDRVYRAMAFAQRAEAVYEKTRNLVILEAETTFIDFDLASENLKLTKEQHEYAKDLQLRVSTTDTKQKDQLLQGQVMAAQGIAAYVEAVYQYLLALAALERVTAGGIQPSFPGR